MDASMGDGKSAGACVPYLRKFLKVETIGSKFIVFLLGM